MGVVKTKGDLKYHLPMSLGHALVDEGDLYYHNLVLNNLSLITCKGKVQGTLAAQQLTAD